jgi:flagellar hook-associated protein 3 FlgL
MMRISTRSIFETGTSQLNNLQSQMAKTQQQLATQRRMLTAADDPIASARVLEVSQSQSINTQFATNRANARDSLSHEELALKSTASLIQDLQDLVVSAGNGSLSQSDLQIKAVEVEGRLNDLIGLANTADGVGGYVFSGYKSATQPFIQTAGGASYLGDQGQRELQVGSSRKLAISDAGSTVFESAMSGNGTFRTAASPGNTGSGTISGGTVTNPQLLTGHQYDIAFANAGAPPVMSYTITDKTSGLPVPPPPAAAPPIPYQAGQQIAFDGIAFDVKGAPAVGDKFTVDPSQRQSVFQTVTDLIATLRAPSAGPAGQAALTSGLATASLGLASALDNVLSVQASVGARQKELDYLDSSGSDLGLQYSDTLSQLRDLDVVKAMTEYSQQQFALDVAQKSFKTLSGLSLFNYIS